MAATWYCQSGTLCKLPEYSVLGVCVNGKNRILNFVKCFDLLFTYGTEKYTANDYPLHPILPVFDVADETVAHLNELKI